MRALLRYHVKADPQPLLKRVLFPDAPCLRSLVETTVSRTNSVLHPLGNDQRLGESKENPGWVVGTVLGLGGAGAGWPEKGKILICSPQGVVGFM